VRPLTYSLGVTAFFSARLVRSDSAVRLGRTGRASSSVTWSLLDHRGTTSVPSEVPALPSLKKLHKFVSDKLIAHGFGYRTGVVYTTNRRLWEHDQEFLDRLRHETCMAIDMETATLFIVGHYVEDQDIHGR
jgi:nucleoside phosphorylase